MMHRKPKPLTVAINVFLIFTMLLCVFLPSIHAHGAESESTESTDPGNYNIESYTGDLKIVVSLGDSYASGEGVEPFYGQDQIDYKNNIFPEDWRAHRSENSWSSKLHLTFNDGWTMVTLKDAKVDQDGNFHVNDPSGAVAWFFEASSGATSDNWAASQSKTVKYFWDPQEECVVFSTLPEYAGRGSLALYTSPIEVKKVSKNLPPQSDVFEKYELKGKVDYVTLTMGGNDIGFADLVTDALVLSLGKHLSALETETSSPIGSAISSYLCPGFMQAMLNDAWETWNDEAREDLKNMYFDIAEKAGKRAAILVAGYPKLLSPGIFSEPICDLINKNATAFNEELKSLVRSCRREGLNIYFIDVEDAFEGHAAYSEDPHITPIMLPPEMYDLDQTDIKSSYSMHPNNKGTDDYARCVQEYLDRLDLPSGHSSPEGKKRPKIITQPQDLEGGVDDTFVFTVEAKERDGDSWLNENPCMFFWWEYSTDDGESWNDVPDDQNTKSSLTASVSEDYTSGTLFRCRVIDRYGYSVWTDNACLRIRDDGVETDTTEKDSGESGSSAETPANFYEFVTGFQQYFALLDMNEDGISEIACKRIADEQKVTLFDPLIAAEDIGSLYNGYESLVGPPDSSEPCTTEIDDSTVAYIQENYPKMGLKARKGIFYIYGLNQDEAKFCFYDQVFDLYNFNGYYYFSSGLDRWDEEDIISGTEYRKLWSLLVDNGSVKPLEFYESTDENRAALLPYYPLEK